MTRGQAVAAAARAVRRRPAVFAALLWALAPLTAHADWLVTGDGTRIQTEGPWSVQGKLVVFELPNGTLSSLRLSQVDLEASERATAEAAAAQREATEPATRPQKAVFVLTDKDVAHVGRGAADTPAGDSEGAAEETREEAAAPREAVAVVSWEQLAGEEGVVISGTARNTGDAVAADLRLTVVLSDPEGQVATKDAELSATALPPRQSISFRADFPGVFAFQEVRFDFQYQPLNTQISPPPPAATPTREPGS